MNARNQEFSGSTGLDQFLFCSQDTEAARQLAIGLEDLGVLVQEPGSAADVALRVATLAPRLIFVDFARGGSAEQIAVSVDLAQALTRNSPGVPLIAVGNMAHPGGAIAAIRAGVREFIDLSAGPAEVRGVVGRVIETAAREPAPAPAARGKLVALLGVRAGVGTSTLAVHLGAAAHAYCSQAHPPTTPGETRSRAALLDLGQPVGDGQLYLNVASEFHFAEAVRNLRRLDETLVRSALARSSHCVTVVPLPRDLGEMRSVSLSDSMALMDRLRMYFDVVFADVGGLSNPDFIDNLVNGADEAWLITDQSVGALVSLADLLRELDTRGIRSDRLRLIVNRYDERYGMTADQISERFGVRLLVTLPDRILPLMSSTNQGKLLSEVAERDPYVRGVNYLIDKLVSTRQPKNEMNWVTRWLPQNKKAHV
ncbi:pilus assembly protein CpaE [Pigmentiphaga aceris]|uniref:Pilus assembly protein CpaE n=1 Tax=Pigmentiphaga aceris TaxID=1940612 RepID=A0A5C0AVL6_9BURK|nr:pilus assembly protein CpaE [Pigmentiphaga aceris]QEI05644.1 pilus assembly protein CpaE [Pigmentiphaga aceris]